MKVYQLKRRYSRVGILNKAQAKKDPNNNFKIELKPMKNIPFRYLIAFKPQNQMKKILLNWEK